MHRAYQLQSLKFNVIERQFKKSHLLATVIVYIQKILIGTSAVATSRDTQHIAATKDNCLEHN